jgi:hypothetical protein
MSRASLSMGERLRKMNDQASLLDKRLRLHSEESKSWHTPWDDLWRLDWHRSCNPILYGQGGADALNTDDGGSQNKIVGGQGYDYCQIDPGDAVSGCNVLYVNVVSASRVHPSS